MGNQVARNVGSELCPSTFFLTWSVASSDICEKRSYLVFLRYVVCVFFYACLLKKKKTITNNQERMQ